MNQGMPGGPQGMMGGPGPGGGPPNQGFPGQGMMPQQGFNNPMMQQQQQPPMMQQQQAQGNNAAAPAQASKPDNAGDTSGATLQKPPTAQVHKVFFLFSK